MVPFLFPKQNFSKITMSKRKSEQSAESPEWEVENIVTHRLNAETLQTEFRVKWKGFPTSANSWEPLDNIYKCPLILRDMVKKKRAAYIRPMKQKKVAQEDLDKMGNFKPLPKAVTDKFKDPMEYIPEGNETIAEIHDEILSDQGIFLWPVSFAGVGSRCFIRKCVAAYYWPFDAALALKKQVVKCEKIKRFMAKLEREEK